MVEEEEIKKEEPFKSHLVADYFDKIEEMFDNKPDKRKKSEYKMWVIELNSLIDDCNKLTKKFKVYDTIK